MNKNSPKKHSRAKSERGGGLVDYALLLTLVAIGSIGALSAFNNSIRKLYCERVLQFNYAEKEGGGNLRITWNDSDPEEDAFCLKPEGEVREGYETPYFF